MALLKIIDANSVPGKSVAHAGTATRMTGASLHGIDQLQKMGLVGAHTIVANNGYMGIPSIDDHSIGSGKEKRQAISFVRSNLSGRNYLEFPFRWSVKKGEAFKYTYGFNFRIVQNAGFLGNIVASSSSYYLAPFYCSLFPANYFSLTNTRNIVAGGRATNVTMETNKDYYVEIQVSYDPAVDDVNPDDPSSNFNLRYIARVDGNVVADVSITKASTWTATAWSAFGMYTGSTTSSSNPTCLLFSDIYITDGSGSAPYNGFLGPVKALPFYPKSVEETEWHAPEGMTPAEALSPPNHFNDDVVVTTPDDNVEAKLRMKMDVPVDERSIVMGMNFYSRGNRDTGADRSLQGRVFNDEGVLVHEGQPQTVEPVSSNNLLYSILPASVADTAPLVPARLGNYVFEFEAPLTV